MKNKVFMNTFSGAEVAEANQAKTLIPVQQSKHDEAALAAVSAGDSKFLPRLQLMTMRSSKVAVDGFPANHFAVIDSRDIKDLGDTVDILLIAWRPKALDTSGDNIVTCYEPKFDKENVPTGLFKEIQDKSGIRDSGCMYGPEYLVYIPVLKRFATLYCGSITMRYEAPALTTRLGNSATLRPQKISPKKGDPYFSTKVYDCTTEVGLHDLEEMKTVGSGNGPGKAQC